MELIKIKLPIDEKPIQALIDIRDQSIDIFCISENEGRCPTDALFPFMMAVHNNLGIDKSKSDIDWHIHKEYLKSSFSFDAADDGYVRSFSLDNKRIMHSRAFDIETCRNHNYDEKPSYPRMTSPLTVYPVECEVAREGFIYWVPEYGDNESVILADAKKLLNACEEATQNGGIPHIKTDRETSLKHGGFLLRRKSLDPYGMARLTFNNNAFKQNYRHLAFLNGYHRLANAIAFGCAVVPIESVNDDVDTQSLANKVASHYHRKP